MLLVSPKSSRRLYNSSGLFLPMRTAFQSPWRMACLKPPSWNSLTNGRRDYAVVLTPLGGVQVNVWNPALGQWRN